MLTIYQGGPISRIEGDINGDGLVGSGDLDAIRGHWGNPIEHEFAFVDCNHDGRVDSTDLDVVRANWGEASAKAVPEPSGIVLFFSSSRLL